MSLTLPPTAVIRVSRGNFDPARFAEVELMTRNTGTYLIPAINRLPGLLSAARPALEQLDTVAVDGTPLVQQIHAAVPALNRVANDLGPFVKIAKPGLVDLGAALKKAIPAIRDTTPLTETLRSYTARSLPGTKLVARLFENLQQHGFVENLLSVFYYVQASLARFDQTSHLLSVLLIGPQNGVCGNYATTPVAACSAHYGTGPKYTPSKALARQAQSRGSRAHAAKRSTRISTAAAPATSAPTPAQTSTTPQPGNVGSKVLSQLLQGTKQTTASTSQTLQNLLNYLVK